MEDYNIAARIGERIKLFRQKKGMSQKELADRIGKGKGVVSKYESGQVVMDVITLREIATILEVPVSELIEDRVVDRNHIIRTPTAFVDSDHVYMYILRKNGERNVKVLNSYFAITPVEDTNRKSDEAANVIWYNRLRDQNELQSAATLIPGTMMVYETTSLFYFVNERRQNFRTMIYAMNFINDEKLTSGLMLTVASYPLVPIASRIIFSKDPMASDELLDMLTLNKSDRIDIQKWNGLTIKSGMLFHS